MGSCRNQPRVWGAAEGFADVEVALAGCEVCKIAEGCVDRFAAKVPQPSMSTLTGLVVGGLHGRDLLAAVNRARKVAA